MTYYWKHSNPLELNLDLKDLAQNTKIAAVSWVSSSFQL